MMIYNIYIINKNIITVNYRSSLYIQNNVFILVTLYILIRLIIGFRYLTIYKFII